MKKSMRYISLALCLIAVLSFTLYGCAGIYGLPNENYRGGEIITDGENTIASGTDGENGESGAGGEIGKSEVGQNSEPQKAESAAAKYIRAKVSSLSIRSAASASSTALGTLDKGDMVCYLSIEGGFYKTYYKNKTAYVSRNPAYTEIVELAPSENQKVEDVIDIGLKLLGTPYVYGAVRLHNGKGVLLSGFSTGKFDCSSLMQYMFYKGASVNLDTTTRTQIKQGTYVAKANIARGDLLFFTNASRKNNTGIERVGHVALYLGENYILHTASDHAVIEQISSVRWSYYIEARK